MHQINLFEGRDPDRRLKPADFNKMFFDTTETFSGTAKFRAMPWPPEVKPNQDRDFRFGDPRFFKEIRADDFRRFEEHLKHLFSRWGFAPGQPYS